MVDGPRPAGHVITVRCESCSTEFPVDLRKVPVGGVNAQCSICFGLIWVDDVAPEEVDDVAPMEELEPPPTGHGAEPVPDTRTAGLSPEPAATAALPAEPPAPGEEVHPRSGEAVASPAGTPAMRERPGEDVGPAPEEPDVGPGVETPVPESPAGTGEVAEVHEVEQEARDSAALLAEESPGAAPRPLDLEPGEMPGGATPPGATEVRARPRFGKRDPAERARRLARVLVSDMVAYHPTRHRQALDQGDLAEEFADEIGRSWKEYVEQVGEELAESTTYFQDALNEILAEGQDIF